MTATRYERDTRGLAALLIHQEMGAAMMTFARAGERYFQTIAPRRSSTYANAMTKVPVTALGPTPRRAVRLEVDVAYAAKLEQTRGTLGKVADVLDQGGPR